MISQCARYVLYSQCINLKNVRKSTGYVSINISIISSNVAFSDNQ